MNQRAAVIIVAAGSGSRMQAAVPKQYLPLAGRPLLVHSIDPFARCPFVERIIVVVPAERIEETGEILAAYSADWPPVSVVAGGRRRQDSVKNGLDRISDDDQIVLVHDGARPFVSASLIERCFNEIVATGAAIAAVPVKDTVKQAGVDGRVAATVDRTHLWLAQTPQGARKTHLVAAFARLGDREVTDESSLLEAAGIPVRLVPGEETNIKITTPEDLVFAEAMVAKQTPQIKIGHGFDAHRFSTGRPLVLGGVHIDHHRGLAGHSDADVVTHALCDALLGAMGEGDIGRHFPDHDPAYAGICSLLLLERVMTRAASLRLAVANADITVVCQAPRLAPHLEAMQANLARCCRVAPGAINVKATTTERMGFTGREEGIACHAVVLLHNPLQQETN